MDKWGMPFPQASCCHGCSTRWPNVYVLEQNILVLVLLLLMLLDTGHLVSHRYLPLWVLVYCTLYGSGGLHNGCKPSVDAVLGLAEVMVPSARERHASSLMPTWGCFIILPLVVVKVPTMPLFTWSMLPVRWLQIVCSCWNKREGLAFSNPV